MLAGWTRLTSIVDPVTENRSSAATSRTPVLLPRRLPVTIPLVQLPAE